MRQHACACRARYCYGKSVCLSITLWYCIETNAHAIKLFPPSSRAWLSNFAPTVTIFQGELIQRGAKYMVVGKICNFWHKLIILERVQDRLIHGTPTGGNRQPTNQCWFQWPWVTLKGGMWVVKVFWWISIITPKWFDLEQRNLMW